jgi:hypothetical protein
MIWLLFFLVTSAFGTETQDALQQRLLGDVAEPIAMVEPMENDGIVTPKSELLGRARTAKAKVEKSSPLAGMETVTSLWPFFIAIFAAGGFLVMRKKGLKIPGLSNTPLAPKVPMKVVSRNSLGGNAAILLVDVEGTNGEVRRLLLSTGGNSTPTLVTDLSATSVQNAPMIASEPAIPESFTFTTKQTPVPANNPVQPRVRMDSLSPVAEFDDHEYQPEGVEPGSDPLQTRLRRVHRHRQPGAPSAATKKAGNWRVKSFGSDQGETDTTIDDNGITVRVAGGKSHLESFAAQNKSEEQPAPRLAKVQPADSQDRKRLDVSNAFEAELRRRVYDASPSERKARSDAARELVDKMIQERLGEARSA